MQCSESIPLLTERIAILRENGRILCEVRAPFLLPDCSILTPSKHFDGSFKRFCDAFLQIHGGKGTALQLAKMIVDTFPSFRDEAVFDGEKCMCFRTSIV